MEITITRSLPEQVPVPLFKSFRIGTAENRGELFDIYIGLDENLVSQLKTLSLNLKDTDLQENTSDHKRFGEGSYEQWYAKGRVPFALVHKNTGELAALAWFGPKLLGRKSMKHLSSEELSQEHPIASTRSTDEWHTIAFRCYAPFRGTGIMKGFAQAVTDAYVAHFPHIKLWTSNSRANIASVKLSEKLGYHIDETLSDSETVTMIR